MRAGKPRERGSRGRRPLVPAARAAQPGPAAPTLRSAFCLRPGTGIVPGLRRCDNKAVKPLELLAEERLRTAEVCPKLKQDVQGGFVLLKALCSHGPSLEVVVCGLLALAVPSKTPPRCLC